MKTDGHSKSANSRIFSYSLLLAGFFLVGCEDFFNQAGDDEEPPPPNDTSSCSAENPICGDGPRAGCGEGFICNTSCECIEVPSCIPDAPQCEGEGPNSGCEDDFLCNGSCECVEKKPSAAGDVLQRASRSTSIDISYDDQYVVMVNSDDDSITTFAVSKDEEKKIAVLESSDRRGPTEPVAALWHPNGNDIFVANRGAGSVVKISNGRTQSAKIEKELYLGGEIMGIALSPSGQTLWATNWINGTLSAIDTEAMEIKRTIPMGINPYAVAVTNDGDNDDSDETILVTEFYGQKISDIENTEANDLGRQGYVYMLEPGSDEPRTVVLPPLEDCFKADVGDELVETGCFPNQLNSISIHTALDQTYAFITAVAASPEGPVDFRFNVQSLVLVIDVKTGKEVPEYTVNLNQLVQDQQFGEPGFLFINVPSAIAFINDDNRFLGYITSAAGNIVLRLLYEENGKVIIGTDFGPNIPVGANPTGLVTSHIPKDPGAYTANLLDKNMSVINFKNQREIRTIESTPAPAIGTPEGDILQGKKFFNTSRAIWSAAGWGSCQACHPMGLTDNVTWSFPAGPRQTIALDGQYASNDPTDMRALNWTAIFDETHDFELNVRGVSGGAGAIQNEQGPINSGPNKPPFVEILVTKEFRENHQALNGSLTFISRDETVCSNENTCPDWDFVDTYIKSIRSPSGRVDSAELIDRGRQLFEEAYCHTCHAGPKWTISQTFYDVTKTNEEEPPNREFEVNRLKDVLISREGFTDLLPLNINEDNTLIDDDDSNGGNPALKRQACNIRQVRTFGAEGGAEEIRDNGQPAQGPNGYNPPSLLGLATGAPYFHNGAAKSLEDLFDSRFSSHYQAANANFKPTGEDLSAIKAYLLSIDENTVTFDIIEDTLLCKE